MNKIQIESNQTDESVREKMSVTMCKHRKLLSYIGYINVFFCPNCGLRFNAEPKYDERLEGNKCQYIDMVEATK